MINYIVGDATNPIGDGLKIIPHICNDRGVWGAGFVLALSKRWPETEYWYCKWHKNRRYGYNGIPFELGQVQYVGVDKQILVANMIAQELEWKNGPPIRYDALERCMKDVAGLINRFPKQREQTGKPTIHAPRFGCGLAGSSWDIIEPMIKKEWCDKGINVFIYDLPPKAA